MNETMLARLGFVTIITVIVLLLKNVTVPSLAFISVATASSAVLVLTGTFSLQEMGDFIAEGVKGVHATAALFIFSVLFFGIMTDVGMFDKIIGALMKKVGHNVIGVTLMTSIIAMIAHLDGAGAVTDVEITAGGNVEEQTEAREYARQKLFWFNLILTLAVIVCLIFVKVPSYQNTIHIKFLRKNPSWCCRKMRSTQRDFSICSKTTESKIVPWSIH